MSDQKEIIVFIIVISTIVFILFCAIIVFFVLYYMKRRKSAEEELKIKVLEAQIAIQEQTSEHISREIHDDVGQVLSVARIYLQGVEQTDKIVKTNALISRAISSLRNISHSLNASQLLNEGIVIALQMELQQIEESGIIKTIFKNEVEHFQLKPDQELILFRTCQEALNNAIKHSEASLLSINLNETELHYEIRIADNGKGFIYESEPGNIAKNGVKNMQKRAELIGAKMEIKSLINKGTTVSFIILKDHEKS